VADVKALLDNALTTSRGDVTRVAFIEDDLDLIEVMTALFEGQGIETFHAHTAAAAVELIPRVEPDLVVLDPDAARRRRLRGRRRAAPP